MNHDQENRNRNQNKNGRETRDPLRTGLPLLALAVVIVLLFNWVYNSITSAQLEEKSYTDFLTMVQRDQLAEVQFKVDRVLFLTKEEAGQAGGARTVYYTGLITGTDLIAQLKGKLRSHTLGIPEVMLREEKDKFLDDVTVKQLEKALGVRVRILTQDGAALVKALCK